MVDAQIANVERLFKYLGYLKDDNRYYEAGKHGVSFSISRSGAPMVLIMLVDKIENRLSCWDELNKSFHEHYSRYAIITDGRWYEFYSDLIAWHELYDKPFLAFNFEEINDKQRRILSQFERGNLRGENLCIGPICAFDAKNRLSPTGLTWREIESNRREHVRKRLEGTGLVEIPEEAYLNKNIPSYNEYFSLKPSKNRRT